MRTATAVEGGVFKRTVQWLAVTEAAWQIRVGDQLAAKLASSLTSRFRRVPSSCIAVDGRRLLHSAKAKTPRSECCRGVLHNKSLAMTYF
ncbi:hypothetical protein, partial [Cupriavidus necator]|uniref:hypothetical protein n=1 Tax=Cupriavidus necator TaxID=106590 RepID=UPI001C0FD449